MAAMGVVLQDTFRLLQVGPTVQAVPTVPIVAFAWCSRLHPQHILLMHSLLLHAALPVLAQSLHAALLVDLNDCVEVSTHHEFAWRISCSAYAHGRAWSYAQMAQRQECLQKGANIVQELLCITCAWRQSKA